MLALSAAAACPCFGCEVTHICTVAKSYALFIAGRDLQLMHILLFFPVFTTLAMQLFFFSFSSSHLLLQ